MRLWEPIKYKDNSHCGEQSELTTDLCQILKNIATPGQSSLKRRLILIYDHVV